jgi:signal transduction histidine kinase
MNGLAANIELARAGVEVALLDTDGVIVEVNEAWTRFAVANGGDPARTGVGVSYLAVCEATEDDEVALSVAAAVRAAVGGDLPAPMRIRISCDAPDVPRQFDVLVSSRVSSSGELLGATVTLSPTTSDPVPSSGLSLPDGPRLRSEDLFGQLTSQAQGVLRTQGRLRGLLRANAAVTSDLSLPVVLRHLVTAARELVDARYAALGVIGTDGTLAELVHSGLDPATVERVRQLAHVSHGDGLVDVLLDDLRPGDVEHPRDHPGGPGTPGRDPSMTGLLAVPIRIRDQVFGTLYLAPSARGGFTDEDEQLVTTLAASAGVAIENARLFAQAAQERQWLEASTEMTHRLFAGALDEPLDLVLRYAARGAAADFARVVVPHDAHHGRVQAQIGSIDHRRPGDLLELDDTLCGRILAGGKPLLVPDYDSEFTDAARRIDAPDGIGAVAAVPLLDPQQQVLGALLVVRRPGSPALTEHDLALLESFAKHAGIAMTLNQARADREELVLLADHDRIAADLHDHVIQQLFATGMGLNGLVAHQDRPEHQERLLGYVDALDDTIRSIRTTIFELRQRQPTAQGLLARLMAVVDDERPALGFSPRIDFSGNLDRNVPPDVADDLVAVLREALSNIARHAHASSATVRVALTGPLLEVHVTDDGTGTGNPSRSSGLSNLRRRAQAHHGTFEVRSPDTGGTHLHWTARV